MSALDDIAAERRRQIEVKGWSPEHDDEHRCGELALGAAAYATYASSIVDGNLRIGELALRLWPWQWSWWKPKSPRQDLVRAGALIVAEIERLDRLDRTVGRA